MTVDRGREIERVLYVGAWMDVGGAEKFALDALNQLRSKAIRTALVTTVKSEHRWRSRFEPLVEASVDLTKVPLLRRAATFARFASEFDPDVIVISNSRYLYDLVPYVRHQVPRAKIVDYCHAEQPEWRHGGYPRMSIRQGRFLSRTMCASSHLKQWMTFRGADIDRCDVVHCNVDVDFWDRRHVGRQEARESLGLSATDFVVAVVGRLDANKRPLVAFEAIAMAAQAMPITALFVGSGPLEAQLRTRAQASPGVRLEVRSGGPETVRAVYGAADVLMLPSLAEGISLALYEAMAMGLPVLASAVGGHRELIDASTGVLVALSGVAAVDVERFATQLSSLLRSPQLRVDLGAAARRRVVAEFSLPSMGDTFVASLERALPRSAVARKLAVVAWLRATASSATEAARTRVVKRARQVVERSCVVGRSLVGAHRLPR